MTTNYNEIYTYSKEGAFKAGCCFIAYPSDSWRIQKFHRLLIRSIGWHFAMRIFFDYNEWFANKPDSLPKPASHVQFTTKSFI